MNLFDTAVVLLFLSVVTTTIFGLLRMPVIIGYILVGILAGPSVTGVISSPHETYDLAEIGIVFLLFAIGLQFSLKRMIVLRRIVFGYGLLQVLLTIIVGTVCGICVGMTLAQSIVIGAIIAMSSTAIVSKLLMDKSELHTKHGTSAIGILLFQDLAVVPILILIPSLVDLSGGELAHSLGFALVKACIALIFILAMGRWTLKPLFKLALKLGHVELFTLTVLFITLGCAWITYKLGLSMALGGFIAGMMIGETEFKKQIDHEIRPFRDVFLAFFFVSIGTQFDLSILMHASQWILLMLAALICFKTIVIALLGKLFKLETSDALSTGFILAHGGEFGFAVLALALSYELLPPDYGQAVLGAMLLSMILSPLMIHYHEKLSHLITLKKN